MFNLPNKITLSRIALIPVFMIIMLAPLDWGVARFGHVSIEVTHLVGAILFIVASTTDWIDGYYARKLNLVTNFGKFLDPLADKLLVSAALIILVQYNLTPAWMAIVIISREFAVTGLRLVLAGGGEVVAANMLGKVKTWAQIIAISALLLHNLPFELVSFPFGDLAMWVAVFFTVVSGWDYFVKNWEALKNSN
ncbi:MULTISPECIES: CDP-diacylglycerol--glycerol-3-phosphate 3-phosphatidyltransferase [Bacillus]|jgi:CDP-diacylglycerol--glycerol-3-phosphate 3-phosphatidyltransferase|uniref:CDP-diacylglycerol--glycerol-3-phosphate 3-phosphatidyltransferase n=1 Tax=Bacillus pumilus (strain SAFR-032) TaxID=315750 RepID=A8FDG1_BACP2|nr:MULTISPECIES: CDP-diacylglycerol--glycerol-3-phosphate 3-phosphatidyltransferase [Bacillus]MDR4996576.1 CDP-diacylglycerol--glycerol-3-phosphate 3-phosphatidyltransferase [Bacillus altitudinis]ABV62278.1 CDP-diacylglycerol--glycerol-3-phosphate 3-phosphatidyltransferase [Bacillus pumilus SAFR-032]AVI40985.1 CDP-diacylglycerol--glycerol-3-phosphate 3-phosphatidyltransferase [Bacillus pumilus]MBC3642906.1 CDP-diacylglycerol--glycerol-3-phosphate 3-phosphatidyltransferase [Bacillus pumilus]MBC